MDVLLPKEAKFDLGRLVATQGAIEALGGVEEAGKEAMILLNRFVRGDWGEVDSEDWATNDQALKNGSRLLGAYTTKSGEKLWIVTEWDRSISTLTTPEEY